MIDTHTHLGDPRLINDVPQIIEQAKQSGVSTLIEVGYNRASVSTAMELIQKYNNIYAIVGTHPHDSNEWTDQDFDNLVKIASHPKVVGIGEIGLDYYYDNSPRDVQRQVFENQILLAHQVGLPISLHIRDAFGDLYEILNTHKDKLTNGILLHCYSGSAEFISQLKDFDCYYALGGAITFKNAKKDDVIKAIPWDRLLLETDCPYMTPVPHRGQTNYPKYLEFVAQKIAQTLQVDLHKVIAQTTTNAKRLFKKL